MNKKILILFFLLVGSFLTINMLNVKAADGEFIELYPYDDIRALDPNSDFTAGSKVGSANWTLTYGGYRYHTVRSSLRYAKDFKDANSNGTIEASELGSTLSWNAFASIIVNQENAGFELATTNGRADFTTVVHRIYSYFDEDGYLYMFEDQINLYYIRNKGTNTIEGQNWELVPQSEIDAFEKNEAGDIILPEGVQENHIRIALDGTEKGYTLEPLKYTTWNHIWTGDDHDGTSHPTSIIRKDQNVDNVRINAGDTIVSFGTLDRDGTNRKTLEFITLMPYLMIDETQKIAMQYEEQAPTFGDTLIHLDKDVNTPGINYVVEYLADFTSSEFTDGVKATYVNMFDENDKIVNEVKVADYKIEVFEGESLVEEVNATWNAETNKYEFDKEITAIDSKNFGDSFKLVYSSTSPVDETLVTATNVDVAVGVYPPRFVGVPTNTVFSNENEYVDLLNGITADDGYGNDISHLINVTTPRGFSPYAPRPGTYTISLDFTYNVFIAGVKPELVFTMQDGEKNKVSYDGINKPHANANVADVHLYTKEGYDAIVKDWPTMAWTSELLVVEDGKIVMAYSRGSNKVMNEANPLPTNSADNTNAVGDQWYKTLELTENQTAIVVRGTSSIPVNGWAKAAFYEQELEIIYETDDIDHDFNVSTTYTLQIDDITAPELTVKNDKYTFDANDFDSVDEAILNNVSAKDNFSNVEVFILSDGGLKLNVPGTYTVTVLGVDAASNETELTFTITVKEVDKTLDGIQDDLKQAQDDLKDAQDALDQAKKDAQDKIDALEKELQDAIDGIKKPTPLYLTVIISVVAAGAAFGGAFLLLRKK